MSESQAPRKVPGLPFPLQGDETVLEICRRHWIYLWPTIVLFLVLAILPPLIIALLLSAAGGFEGTAAKVFWVVAGLYLLYWAGRIFFAWYRYRHDIWVITNQRIVDSFKRHPFSLVLSTADLVSVQDMTVEREGIFKTMLDYGDIVCQTAAEQQEFRMVGVPHPRAIQALVDKERDRERMRTR